MSLRTKKNTRKSLYSFATNERRAVLYARYSSDMQRDSWSAEAQLSDLRRHCQVHGWQIVAEHIDEAQSAKSADRPEFQKALESIRSGRANVIVVHKLDRFSRNMEDTFRLVNEFEQVGAGLVCTQQGIDTTNPISGKIVLAVLAALAEAYLDNLSEETSKGKRARVANGLPNGDLPFGYANPDAGTEASGAGINNSTVPVIVSKRAAVVQIAFELYASGQYSHATLARTLNLAGHRMISKLHPEGYPFTKDTITAILGNRFYCGQVRYGETWLPGKHEAIIDEEGFERVQAVHAQRTHIGRRGSAENTKRTYVAQGLVKCICCRQPLRANAPHGRRLTYQDKSTERGIACTATRRAITSDLIEDALLDAVGKLILPGNWRDLILESVDEERDELQRVTEQRKALDRQLEQAQRYLLDGFITEDQFREKRAAIDAERANLQPPTQIIDLDHAATLLENLPALWQVSDEEDKREITRALFDAIWVDLDGRRVVTLQIKKKLRPLRSIFSRTAQSDSQGNDCGQMRNRRDSNPYCVHFQSR